MRVRTVLAAAIASLGLAVSSQASTIFVKLKINDTGATNAVTGMHIYNVQVFGRTDQLETAPGNGDGGIAGFQFDILSNNNTDAVSVNNASIPQAAGVGPNANKVKTTFDPAVSSNFTTQLPNREDGSALNGYASDTDTDIDAPGGSFFSTGFNKTDLGKASSGDGALIATEVWESNPAQNDSLNVFVKGAQFYDFNNTANNFRTNFATVSGVGAPFTVPEPASLGVLALGAVAGLRRRKA